MAREIPQKAYEEIERAISSEESVVGIDAKKTHIMIIHLLNEIDERLSGLEQRIRKIEEQTGA